MIKIETIKQKHGESAADCYQRKINLAEMNYKESRTQQPNESAQELFNRFEDFEQKDEYGVNFILELRIFSNSTDLDSDEKVDERRNNFFRIKKDIYKRIDVEILNSLSRKDDDKEKLDVWYDRVKQELYSNENFIFTYRNSDWYDEEVGEYRTRIRKFEKYLSDIEAELDLEEFRKELKSEEAAAKAKEEGRIEANVISDKKKEKEKNQKAQNQKDKDIYNGFILLMVILLSFIILRSFIWGGSLALIMSGAAIVILIALKTKWGYDKIHEYKEYHIVMGTLYKAGEICNSIKQEANDKVTYRKEKNS